MLDQQTDYGDREFLIFPVSELYKIDFSQVLETDADTVRKSVDGLKTFVKWNGPTVPACVTTLVDTEGPYTYNEMLDILATPEWTDPNPFPPAGE